MGIQGLTKYIDSSFIHCWEDIKLAGCQIVLDGSSLPYHLPGDFDWKFGGQYPAMRESLENLLEALLAEGVSAIHVVFEGMSQSDKMGTLLQRRQGFQDTIRKSLTGQADVDEYQKKNVRPPLMSETLRKVFNDYGSRRVKIYPADEDCGHLAVCLAHTFDCFLVGENSDYFISAIKGYIPLSKLKWGRPGSAVVCKVFKRDAFIASLRIETDLVYAIPALVGNEALPNLVDTTALKGLIRDNPRYRGKDVQSAIKFLQNRCNTVHEMKQHIFALNDRNVLLKFEQSFEKARQQYEVMRPFNNDEFKMSIALKSASDKPIPPWIVEQYRNFMFSNTLLDILIRKKHFLRIIPDDCSKPTSMLISSSIRQDIYTFLMDGIQVTEVIRRQYKLEEVRVGSSVQRHRSIKLEEMNLEEKGVRRKKFCKVMMCDAATLSLLHEERWHLPVASLVFWAKNAAIQRDDIYLKALVLCFVECFLKSSKGEYSPVLSLEALHLYAQWQCVYHDAILLNQVLALPLPYLSPADLFDGKRVTYYSQKSDKEFDAILRQTRDETKHLYTRILEIVYRNML